MLSAAIPDETTSSTFVPSVNTSFVPLSVAAKVTPVPDTVLN